MSATPPTDVYSGPIVHGRLAVEDDEQHPVEDWPDFNESRLYTFFSRTGGLGGFCRIGNRSNEGWAEVTVCLMRADGSGWFEFQRPRIEGNERHDAAGLRFDVEQPGYLNRTIYEGPATAMGSLKELLDPSTAFRSNPKTNLSFDLHHVAAGPMVGASSGMVGGYSGHYHQHVITTGQIRFDDGTRTQQVTFEGQGVRDHSWGRRDWKEAYVDRTFWCSFGSGRGLALSYTIEDPSGRGTPKIMGEIIDGDQVVEVTNATVHSVYEDNDLFHRSASLRLELENGEAREVEVTVEALVPLRHRLGEETLYIGQAMSRFVMGDWTSYGLSEYMEMLTPEGGRRSDPDV